MIAKLDLKQLITTPLPINFMPKSIDFLSFHSILSNQFNINEPFNFKNINHQKFQRHFSHGFPKSKIEILKEKSSLGDFNAQFELGSYYLSFDDMKGIQYIKNAAEHNHVIACYTYSEYLKYGLYVQKNLSESLKFITFAADHNLEIAQSKLAFEYYTGNSYPQDMYKALQYFCLSANNGNASSCETAGTLLIQGIGCKHNKELAIKYYQLGSSLNCKYCKYQLSIMYKIDDKKESIRFLKESADLGYSIAQREYGRYLLSVEKNLIEAEIYFRLAANQNDPESCFNLSELLIRSNDEKRKKEALFYLEKAADLGHEESMLRVGKIFEREPSPYDYPNITNLDIKDDESMKQNERNNEIVEPVDYENGISLTFLNFADNELLLH
ncbi:hypothetical protein M9Y10_041323 [Tritrichomonas musculus]|uniref:Uncharacterized protein n=1 Tax=Tritrichomonas musculus TaxID=1915356 RepID=A0ABR2K417_9EUKA